MTNNPSLEFFSNSIINFYEHTQTHWKKNHFLKFLCYMKITMEFLFVACSEMASVFVVECGWKKCRELKLYARQDSVKYLIVPTTFYAISSTSYSRYCNIHREMCIYTHDERSYRDICQMNLSFKHFYVLFSISFGLDFSEIEYEWNAFWVILGWMADKWHFWLLEGCKVFLNDDQ